MEILTKEQLTKLDIHELRDIENSISKEMMEKTKWFVYHHDVRRAILRYEIDNPEMGVYQVDLSNSAAEDISKVAKKLGVNATTLVVDAVNFYGFIAQLEREGLSLYAHKDGQHYGTQGEVAYGVSRFAQGLSSLNMLFVKEHYSLNLSRTKVPPETPPVAWEKAMVPTDE